MRSWHDKETGINIHYDGDYGGEARIVIPDSLNCPVLAKYIEDEGGAYLEIRLPCKVLVDFGGSAVSAKIVNSIEREDWNK